MDWVRLWLDMPTDPKWRAIARRSGQRVGDVIAVYTHMLVQARQADTPGVLDAWEDEDVAASLDLATDDVKAIREAMQGKVLDADTLTGWAKRQPQREDNSTERVRRHRERKASQEQQGETTQKHKASQVKRDVTQRNAPDTESDTDTESPPCSPPMGDGLPGIDPISRFDEFWAEVPIKRGKGDAEKAWRRAVKIDYPDRIIDGMKRYARQVADSEARYIKYPGPWLNAKRWLDDEPAQPEATTDDPTQPPADLSPDRRIVWQQHKAGILFWRDKGFWHDPCGGPPPGEPGCQVDPRLQRAFGYEPQPRLKHG